MAAHLTVSHLKYKDQDVDLLEADSIDTPSNPFGRPPIDEKEQLSNDKKIVLYPTLEETTMASYSPALRPILDPASFRPNTSRPIAVRFLTGRTTEITSETKFLVDAIERSKYLKLISVLFLGRPPNVEVLEVSDIDSPRSPVIWMVDFLAIGRDCHNLEQLVTLAKEMDISSTHTQLVLLDYSASWESPSCPEVEQLVPNIRIAKRGIVKDRHWDQTWVQLGTLAPPDTACTGGPAVYMPHTVREAFISQLRRTKKPLSKVLDVVHFWRKGDNSHYTHLREAVSTVVASMLGKMAGKRKIKSLVRTFGEDENMEVNLVQSRYVEQVLSAKIIVVAQRDEYEDHYRLMESLASGAMVMTDIMLGLPSGFQDKKNIIVYESAKSLEELILYYLNPKNERKRRSIAKKGWALAMGKHRSWHRIEELLFGKPLTHVGKPTEKAPNKRKRISKVRPKNLVDLNDNAIVNSAVNSAIRNKEDDD